MRKRKDRRRGRTESKKKNQDKLCGQEWGDIEGEREGEKACWIHIGAELKYTRHGQWRDRSQRQHTGKVGFKIISWKKKWKERDVQVGHKQRAYRGRCLDEPQFFAIVEILLEQMWRSLSKIDRLHPGEAGGRRVTRSRARVNII